MNILDVYHGAKGDNILKIIEQRVFRPDQSGEIYFVQHEVGEAMQYGVDESRMACYAIRAKVEVPLTASIERLESVVLQSCGGEWVRRPDMLREWENHGRPCSSGAISNPR